MVTSMKGLLLLVTGQDLALSDAAAPLQLSSQWKKGRLYMTMGLRQLLDIEKVKL